LKQTVKRSEVNNSIKFEKQKSIGKSVMVNETGGTFFDGTNYNYEMLNQRSSSASNNQMTVDTHFRKKPKRLPSYIKLERTIDDDNSEDSTSTADSSESGVGGCSLKSRLKMPGKKLWRIVYGRSQNRCVVDMTMAMMKVQITQN
jgi:hypothetical protein